MLYAGRRQVRPHRLTSSAGASLIVDSASALYRAISGGNNAKFTFSTWRKRYADDLGQGGPIFVANNVPGSYSLISTTAANAVYYSMAQSSFSAITPGTIGDQFWHHIHVAYDASLATPAERLLMTIDGVPQAWTGTAGTLPHFFQGYTHWLGGNPGGAWGPSHHKISDTYLVEGAHVPASAFAAGTAGVVGGWLPKPYAGALAGVSFFLDFLGDDLATACADKSGLGNNWSISGATFAANWSSDHP